MEGLTEGDQVSDEHLETISRSCCEKWKSLPAHLELETIVASDIDKKQKDEDEKRHDFFKKWKLTKGSAATYGKLISALEKINCMDDAEKVRQFMGTKAVSPSIPECSCSTAPNPAALDITPPESACMFNISKLSSLLSTKLPHQDYSVAYQLKANEIHKKMQLANNS